MTTVTVDVPANLWVTSNSRLDWRVKARRVRALRRLARMLVKTRRIPPMGRAHLTVHVHPRLSAEFAEWMMGLPAGWVTAVPGVTRGEALKLAGNGVIPQQAAHALSDLASRVDLLDLLAVAS